jgi:hypothetical protein
MGPEAQPDDRNGIRRNERAHKQRIRNAVLAKLLDDTAFY